jgi:hypothetical protein
MVARSPVLHRTRLTILTAVTAVAVCGTADGAAGAPTTVADQVGVAQTSSSGVAAAPTIPVSAFFEMPTNMRRERQPSNGDAAVPKLCNRELAAGAGAVASAVMMNIYQGPNAPEGSIPDGVLYQTIRLYSGNSAAAYMNRVRAGLANCTSYRDGTSTVKVRSRALSGVADEAVTIDLVRPQLDLPGNPTGGEQTNRVVVMRFGTAVTVLYDAEYERSSSVPAYVDIFVREAAKAIRAWRG